MNRPDPSAAPASPLPAAGRWASPLAEAAALLEGAIRHHASVPGDRAAARAMTEAFMRFTRLLLPHAGGEASAAIVELCVLETVRAALARRAAGPSPSATVVECPAGPLVSDTRRQATTNPHRQDDTP
jgi:hypothetical protein